MDRRGFLKGVFGGVTAAGVIVAASPTDIEAFASPLLREAPLVLDAAPASAVIVGAGEHLYNALGELVAIVRAINLTLPHVEVTAFGEAERLFLPAPPCFETIATGVGTVEVHGKLPPILRGKRKL